MKGRTKSRMTGRSRSHSSRPTLVTVAHGTRHPDGNLIAAELTRGAAAALGVPGLTTYVELCEPLLADRMAVLERPAVVVPLLLSTGFHIRNDLPSAVAHAQVAVGLAPPLGPDPLLAGALWERLWAAGARPGDGVVLVAAGSRNLSAAGDFESAERHLAQFWEGPVRFATLTGPGADLSECVSDLRAECERVAVAPYLLAEGFFAERCRRDAATAGAELVAEVLGAHPLVIELIAARYAALCDGPLAATG
ncbi:MAG: sirohydrochlorin chelatase [Nocardioides sp.]